MPDTAQHRNAVPPRVPGPTSDAWREGALTRAAELRGRLEELIALGEISAASEALAEEVLTHVVAAEEAASGRRADGSRIHGSWLATVRGAAVERAISQLDAAEVALLRLAPDSYVLGQLPAILSRVRGHLPPEDPRLQRLVRIADRYADGIGVPEDWRHDEPDW